MSASPRTATPKISSRQGMRDPPDQTKGSGVRRALDIPELRLRKCAQRKGDTIEKALSHGVFLASHPLLGCRTILRVRKTRHATREAAILKHLTMERWGGAPRFLGMWAHRDLVCLRVEYIEGTTATDVFFRKHLEQPDIDGFSRTLARLLRSLHATGVVHLDVKPDNIVIRPDGSVALIDWEHARFSAEAEPLGVCGTLNFVAPEVLLGKAAAHPSLDVWSYGVSVFVLATGQFPTFRGKSLIQHPFLTPVVTNMLRHTLRVNLQKRLTFDQLCAAHFSLKTCSWSEEKLLAFRKQDAESGVFFGVARSSSDGPPKPRTRASLSPWLSSLGWPSTSVASGKGQRTEE